MAYGIRTSCACTGVVWRTALRTGPANRPRADEAPLTTMVAKSVSLDHTNKYLYLYLTSSVPQRYRSWRSQPTELYKVCAIRPGSVARPTMGQGLCRICPRQGLEVHCFQVDTKSACLVIGIVEWTGSRPGAVTRRLLDGQHLRDRQMLCCNSHVLSEPLYGVDIDDLRRSSPSETPYFGLTTEHAID